MDYFGACLRYNNVQFGRRFRMPRAVFDRVYKALGGINIFTPRVDAVKKSGIHTLQRIIAAMRMLSYGMDTDSLHE